MRFFLVTTLSMFMAVPALGGPSTEQEARDAFEEGTRFYQYLHYSDALDAFKRAYALRPSYRILYNIAQSQAMLGHPDLALEAFEAYLDQGATDISAGRRAAVERDITELRRRVGELEVNGPRGCEVWIDGERKGHLPMAASLRLPQGDHLVTLRRSAAASCDVAVTVVGGELTSATCEPVERGDPEGPPGPSRRDGIDAEPEERAPDPDGGHLPRDRVVAWTAAGLGVGTLVAAAVCAWKTSEINSTLDAACHGGTCPPEYAGDVEALPRYAGAADGLFAATAVLSAVAVTLFIAPWRRSEPGPTGTGSEVAALSSDQEGSSP